MSTYFVILVDNTIFALESVGKIRKGGKPSELRQSWFSPLQPPFQGTQKIGAYVKLVVSEMTARCGLIVKHMGYVRLLLDKIRVSVQSY